MRRFSSATVYPLLATLLVLAAERGGRAQTPDSTSGTMSGTELAITDPDEFAWQLFLEINRQAKPRTAGIADAAHATIRTYDDDRPVVWESWALASGGRLAAFYRRPNRSEVYLDRGAKPPTWEKLPRGETVPKILESYPGKGLDFIFKVGRAPGPFDPIEDGGTGGVEVRMNRGLYDYLRSNTLYNIEGLEARVRSRQPIDTPRSSREIKARWVPITEADKPRFHWRTTTDAKQKVTIWGLTALHVITRDLPHWFWCDFEHVDYERNAEQYSRDSTTRGVDPPHGRDGIRRETRGTKWETMRLRGTQTTFVDSLGRPTILANSQIEHG